LLAVVLCILASDKLTFLNMIVPRMFIAVDNFAYAAIPFFIFTGNMMERGGISKRLVIFARTLLGRSPASLSSITVAASGFFGAISGSNAATVAAIGGLMIPSMEKEGYPKDVAAAVAASAGTLGVVIPPSVPMVTYAITASVSVTTMFIAGIIPGLLLLLALIGVNIVKCANYETNKPAWPTARVIWQSFRDAFLALMMPVIIIGGIYGGIFTPTEAAAVACAYALFVSLCVYREIGLKEVVETLIKSAITSSAILFVIAASSPFQWYMTSTGMAQAIATGIMSMVNSEIFILLLINIVLLFLGCFLETTAIILLITPVLLPIANLIGYDPICLGLIMVVNTSIGMITPPMALNLFVASGIAKVSMESVSRRILPYLAVEVAVLLTLTYASSLILWLPRLMGYSG
jgi:C4-dicarboxylate transporter DctM subunit